MAKTIQDLKSEIFQKIKEYDNEIEEYQKRGERVPINLFLFKRYNNELILEIEKRENKKNGGFKKWM